MVECIGRFHSNILQLAVSRLVNQQQLPPMVACRLSPVEVVVSLTVHHLMGLLDPPQCRPLLPVVPKVSGSSRKSCPCCDSHSHSSQQHRTASNSSRPATHSGRVELMMQAQQRRVQQLHCMFLHSKTQQQQLLLLLRLLLLLICGLKAWLVPVPVQSRQEICLTSSSQR